MSYRGHIENGVVVFDEPAALPEGAEVRVEPASPMSVGFWELCSFDELARRQGVVSSGEDEALLGGWPEGERNDGFEDAVAGWRAAERESGG
jgi:hypothetical protein